MESSLAHSTSSASSSPSQSHGNRHVRGNSSNTNNRFPVQGTIQQSLERIAHEQEDTLRQEDRAYSEFAAQHESSSQPFHRAAERDHPYTSGMPSQPFSSSLGRLSTMPLRSTPIAIVRPPGVRASEPSGFETDDDDDSEVDIVERDAIRLRRRYGDNSVVPTAASYDPRMIAKATAASMLKAPYLGSLSKSENFLMSLPPISLTDENNNNNNNSNNDNDNMYGYSEDPPSEITSYGSLRESHQRGKFLDGPSSYREPRSGQIRRLDHRGGRPPAGAGLSASLQHDSISIGERIRAAQKLRESQKQQKEQLETSEGDAAGTSTLAMMLNEASKNSSDSQPDEEASELEQFILPSTTFTATTTSAGALPPHELSAFGSEDAEDYDKYDPPTMMSTSMTAFEVLHASRTDNMAGYERNHTQRFVQRKQAQYNAATSASTSASTSSSGLPSEAEIREQRFQPLARSLSDPTPHHLQRSPMLSPTLQQQLHSAGQGGAPSSSTATALGAPSPGIIATAYWPQHHHHHPYGMMVDPSATGTLAQQHVSLPNETTIPSHHPDQIENPDTDAAFDMDME